MAQIILGRSAGRGGVTDEVLEVFEDGRHPGFKVVENPQFWNSKPLPKFRIIHVLGVAASVFEHLLEEDIGALGNRKSDALRILVIDLASTHAADLERDRTIILTTPQITSKRNPDASAIGPP